MNERITRLRNHAMTWQRQPNPRLEELCQESRSRTKGQAEVIREAKAMAHYFANRTLFVREDEVIVGGDPQVHVGDLQPQIFGRQNFETRLCLEVIQDLRLLRPQVGFRCHRDTPPDILKEAVRTLRSGTGIPDFVNDKRLY